MSASTARPAPAPLPRGAGAALLAVALVGAGLLAPAPARAEPGPADLVPAARLDDTLAPAGAASPGIQAVSGARSVLFVPVYTGRRDGQRPAAAVSEIEGRVSDWYRETSSGRVTLSAEALPWQHLTLPEPLPCEDATRLLELGRAAVQQAGRDPGGYDHVVVYVSGSDCPAGTDEAELGGNGVVLRGQLVNLVHELGHNLGLGHADLLRCADDAGRPVPLSPRCTEQEYGDAYNAMGVLENQFAAPHKARLGWLDGQVADVDRSGTHVLAPYERPGTGTAAVRVQTGLRTYWLEARRPVGVDRGLPAGVTAGALLHVDDGSARTLLVDLAPGTPGTHDSALVPGRSLDRPGAERPGDGRAAHGGRSARDGDLPALLDAAGPEAHGFGSARRHARLAGLARPAADGRRGPPRGARPGLPGDTHRRHGRRRSAVADRCHRRPAGRRLRLLQRLRRVRRRLVRARAGAAGVQCAGRLRGRRGGSALLSGGRSAGGRQPSAGPSRSPCR